ncbi:MAG: D-alanyl-D-alanine carboxypeptidase/D-alanyl-D-alanine-endopeptidase [Planctomycetaceae bacterium]|nr:D-alanyl-D-alanine carboxypeptidase/D-alanyl-D-alanine-endopeptidase [Planctomycetaceae bacterium]
MNKDAAKLLTVFLFCLAVSFCKADELAQIISRQKQEKVTITILVIDAESGKILYSKDADKLMTPASNMKIITSSAAIHYLGLDYKFKTKVGISDANLIVIGGGDPLLGEMKVDGANSHCPMEMFSQIADILKHKKINNIKDIIVDVSFFDQVIMHPAWPKDDFNETYSPEINALNFCENCIGIFIRRNDNNISLSVEPENSLTTLINQVQIIETGDNDVKAVRTEIPNKLIIEGKICKPADFIMTTIQNPAALFADVLKNHLSKEGISVNGKIIIKETPDKIPNVKMVKVFKTPFKSALHRCNKYSINLTAECFVKTISAENAVDRSGGNWPHGLMLVSEYLRSINIDKTQYILEDGSGLSRKNKLSAAALVAVLRTMYKSRNRNAFFDSLSTSGVDGTIAKRFVQPPYKNNIIGKTGYLTGIISLCGLCKEEQGDIIFCILTENANEFTYQYIDELTEAIYDRKF